MRLLKNFFGFIVVILLIISFTGQKANALDVSNNVAQGMEISPALVELNAERNKTYNITLNIRNITTSNLNYTSSVADFSSSGETGSPLITSNSGLPDSVSIQTWVNMTPQFSLISHQSTTVIAQINVPENAEPGGHYGVICFTGNIPELQNTNVGLTASAGVLILIRVNGEIIEKASLASFYSSKYDKQSTFFESSPITFVTRIKNEGNIHIKPAGNIEIYDIFGNLVSSIPVNADKSNVLPNSTRRFEEKLNKDWMFGRYMANLAIGYGTTGQAITSTIRFWVIPYKLIITGILVLITLIYIFVRLIKVYNNYIIAKSKNEKTNKTQKNNEEQKKAKKP